MYHSTIHWKNANGEDPTKTGYYLVYDNTVQPFAIMGYFLEVKSGKYP